MSDEQEMITRMVYVVRAKDDLLKALADVLDTDELEVISRPYVVMTEALPYEPYFESWGKAIIKVCKERFLMEQLEHGVLSDPACQAVADIDNDDVQGGFDKWWYIEQAEGFVEVNSSWFKQ